MNTLTSGTVSSRVAAKSFSETTGLVPLVPSDKVITTAVPLLSVYVAIILTVCVPTKLYALLFDFLPPSPSTMNSPLLFFS